MKKNVFQRLCSFQLLFHCVVYFTNLLKKKNSMTNFNMGRLWLGKDGYYRDINGNVIAKKGQALNGTAWKYLSQKYGRDFANHTSMQTRNGNIFQNGKWRFNDIQSDKEGKTASWDEAMSRIDQNAKAAGAKRTRDGSWMQKNPKNNKYRFVDYNRQKLAENRAKNASTQQSSEEDVWEDGIVSGGLQKLGVNKGLANIAGLGASFIPIVAGIDAINDLSRGDYFGAATNALFAIPGIGGALKLGSFGLRGLGKSAKLISKVNRFNKVGQISKPIDHANTRLISTLTNPNFQRRLRKAGKIGRGAGLALGLGGLGYNLYKSVTDEE